MSDDEKGDSIINEINLMNAISSMKEMFPEYCDVLDKMQVDMMVDILENDYKSIKTKSMEEFEDLIDESQAAATELLEWAIDNQTNEGKIRHQTVKVVASAVSILLAIHGCCVGVTDDLIAEIAKRCGSEQLKLLENIIFKVYESLKKHKEDDETPKTINKCNGILKIVIVLYKNGLFKPVMEGFRAAMGTKEWIKFGIFASVQLALLIGAAVAATPAAAAAAESAFVVVRGILI